MEESELIRIHWHVDRSGGTAVYMRVCDDPAHADLQVCASAEEMTERVAKAKLIQAMYELGKEKGIPLYRLRFKISGIEE